MNNILVFVYGSLKRGFHNHTLLKNNGAVFVQNDAVVGTLISLGAYPGLIRKQTCPNNHWCAPEQSPEGDVGCSQKCDSNNKWVFGEIWKVNKECLHRLDTLEGHPNYYTRHLIHTKSGGVCWVYSLNTRYIPVEKQIIKYGIWKV